MNIQEDFADWLDSEGYGTLGTDLFIGSVPLDAPDSCMWVIANGGVPIGKNSTGERQKTYIVGLYYRNTDAEDVYDTMQSLEENINSLECTALGSFDIIEIETTALATDQDIDAEERLVGFLEITILVYQ